MPENITMPTPVFIMLIAAMLWVVFRDDVKSDFLRWARKRKFQKKPVDECEYYHEQELREKTQIPELN